MNKSKTPKKLGLISLTALVAGNMIGSGVFILPANLARVGSISLLSWLFTATGAFLLALVFSKMSTLLPKTGGPYVYSEHAFGRFIGFQTAYTYWFSSWVGNAAIAVAMIGYLKVFCPWLSTPILETAAALSVVWILTFINMRGVHLVGVVQVLSTILKFVPLLLVAIFGWFYFHPHYLTESFNVSGRSNWHALSYAATLTLWAFIGVESATMPVESTINPKRNIPLATLFGTVIAALVYIASSTAIMGLLPAHILMNSASPFAAAAGVMFGKIGEEIVAAGAVISCFGALNGWILVQGQIAITPAREKLFPKIFGELNKFGVPAKGLFITSILVSILLLATISRNLVDQFQTIILMAATGTLIAYFYTAIAQIIVVRDGEIKRGTALSMVVAILAAIYSAWAFFGSGKEIIFLVTMLLFSSFPLYAYVRASHRNK